MRGKKNKENLKEGKKIEKILSDNESLIILSVYIFGSKEF